VVSVETLKEQIPEGNQRAKEAVVEALGFESRQLAQGAVGQESEEPQQQLSRSEGGWGGGGLLAEECFFG